jgi:hypothetical protein
MLKMNLKNKKIQYLKQKKHFENNLYSKHPRAVKVLLRCSYGSTDQLYPSIQKIMLIILSFNLFQCIQVKQTTKDFETA